MTRANGFLKHLKSSAFQNSQLIMAAKITLCAILGSCVILFFTFQEHLSFGWWICATIFSIPASTLMATYVRSIQRLTATVAGCLVGILVAKIVDHNPVTLCIFTCINSFIWSLLRIKDRKQEYTYILGGILCFLVFSSNFFHTSPSTIALLRTCDTLIGTVIVFVIFYIIWPSKQDLPREIKDESKKISKNLSQIFQERMNSYFFQQNISLIQFEKKVSQTIENIQLLKKLEEETDLALSHKIGKIPGIERQVRKMTSEFFYMHSARCEELLALVNHFPMLTTAMENNILLEASLNEKMRKLVTTTTQFIEESNLNFNEANFQFLKDTFLEIKSEFKELIANQTHLKKPTPDNLKAYEFLKIFEEMTEFYEKFSHKIS